MSNIVGQTVMYGDGHPQALMDAIYEEVFDGYPEDAEIDLLVAVDPIENGDGRLDGFTVVNYQIARVDSEFFLSGEDPRFQDALKDYDTWGRSQDSEGYILIHKHPENNPYPSDKDEGVLDALATIDFVRTPAQEDGRQRRTFMMMVVTNRNVSLPMSFDHGMPRPIDDREIDTGMLDKLIKRVSRFVDKDDPIWAAYDLARVTMDALFDAREAGDRMGEIKAHMAMIPVLMRLQAETDRLSHDNGGGVIAGSENLREGLLELLEDMPPDARAGVDIDEVIARIESLEVGEAFELELPGGKMVAGKASMDRPLEGNWDAPVSDEPLVVPPREVIPTQMSALDSLDLSTLGDPMAATRAALAAARGAPVVAVAADSVSDPSTPEAAESEGMPSVPERPAVPDVFRNMGGPIDFGPPPSI